VPVSDQRARKPWALVFLPVSDQRARKPWALVFLPVSDQRARKPWALVFPPVSDQRAREPWALVFPPVSDQRARKPWALVFADADPVACRPDCKSPWGHCPRTLALHRTPPPASTSVPPRSPPPLTLILAGWLPLGSSSCVSPPPAVSAVGAELTPFPLAAPAAPAWSSPLISFRCRSPQLSALSSHLAAEGMTPQPPGRQQQSQLHLPRPPPPISAARDRRHRDDRCVRPPCVSPPPGS